MLTIPLQPVPAQKITIQLAGQPCTITVKQRPTGIFLDLFVNSAPIVTGVICQNANRIVRDAYLGFIGDLEFVDTQGKVGTPNPPTDPYYTGLGAGGRYSLLYLETKDLS